MRAETRRQGTSVGGGGKAWEAARGPGWDGNKGTGDGGGELGWGRGRARGLGFSTSLRPGKSVGLAAAGEAQTYRQSLPPYIVAHFSFPFHGSPQSGLGPFRAPRLPENERSPRWGVLS